MKTVDECLYGYSGSGACYKILFGDESSNIIGWYERWGWLHKGAEATVPVTLSRRFCLGVLSPDTLHCKLHDMASTATMAISKLAYERYDRFVLFPDSAAYHKSKELKSSRKAWTQDGDPLLPAVYVETKL